MALGLDVSIRNSRAQTVVDAIDAGSAAGELKLYTGVRPATGAALSGNTLLGTLTFSDPCGTISAGVLTFDPVADDISADDTGTLTWGRFQDSDGNFVMDADCGVSGSGATLIFNTVSIIAGGVLRITSGVLTEGGA